MGIVKSVAITLHTVHPELLIEPTVQPIQAELIRVFVLLYLGYFPGPVELVLNLNRAIRGANHPISHLIKGWSWWDRCHLFHAGRLTNNQQAAIVFKVGYCCH